MSYPPNNWSLPSSVEGYIVNTLLRKITEPMLEFIEQELPQKVAEAESRLNASLATAKVGDKVLGGVIVREDDDPTDSSKSSIYLLYTSDGAPLLIPDGRKDEFPYIRMTESGIKFANLLGIVEMGRKLNLTQSSKPVIDFRRVSTFSVEVISESNQLLLRLGAARDDTSAIHSAQVLFHISSKTAPHFGFFGHFATSDDGGLLLEIGTETLLIPLGTTGLALTGIKGMYGERFGPWLHQNDLKDPIEQMASATTKEMVEWSHRGQLNQWLPSRADIRSYGLRTLIGDIFSGGHLISIRDSGLTFVNTGPMIWFGGDLVVLSGMANSQMLGVIDGKSGTALLRSKTELRPITSFNEFLITGVSELQVSTTNPDAWYFAIGGYDMSQAGVEVPWFKLYGGARITNRHVAAAGSVRSSWRAGLFGASADFDGTIGLRAQIGWNPVQVEAGVHGDLTVHVSVCGASAGFSLYADATARFPSPYGIHLAGGVTLPMPWPLDDVHLDVTLLKISGPQNPTTPDLNLLLANSSPVPFLHPPSGMTGELQISGKPAQVWPDIELAVPFKRIAVDRSGVVPSPLGNNGCYSEGGVTVQHVIDYVTLVAIDIQTQEETSVPINGYWRGVRSGGGYTSSSVLGIPSGSPLGWLAGFDYAAPGAPIEESHWTYQYFGTGSAQMIPAPATIELAPFRISSAQPIHLINLPVYKASRAMMPATFHVFLERKNVTTEPVLASEVAVLILSRKPKPPVLPIPPAFNARTALLQQLDGSWDLLALILSRKDEKPISDIHFRGLDGYATTIVGFGYRPYSETPTSDTTTVLRPGRYRFDMSCQSVASYGGTNSDAAVSVVSVTFDVVPPPLRPYIEYSTVGDERMFASRWDRWYPSPRGIGVTHYTDFLCAIRFRVQYMDKIYPFLYIKVTDAHPEKKVTVGPAPSRSKFPRFPWDWFESIGLKTKPSEALFEVPGTAGSYSLSVYREGVTDPKERVQVDSWTYLVSRFANPTEHLTPKKPGISKLFGKFGSKSVSGSSINLVGKNVAIPQYRAGWSLPKQIFVEDRLGKDASLSYFRLLEWARIFDATTLEIVSGSPVVPALETELGLVLDTESQPVALLVRTPEPVDWRRVEIGALADVGGAQILKFNVRILPAADGCSAAFVLEADEIPVRMPLAAYQFGLIYSCGADGLPALRHKAAPNDVTRTESISWSFQQTFGQEWPKGAHS